NTAPIRGVRASARPPSSYQPLRKAGWGASVPDLDVAPPITLLGDDLANPIGHYLHIRQQLALVNLLVFHGDRTNPEAGVSVVDRLLYAGCERRFPPDHQVEPSPVHDDFRFGLRVQIGRA